jgi:Ca2+-binding EF-hand superfamily protein
MKKSLVVALTLCVAGLVAFADDEAKKEKKADKVRPRVLEKYDKNANGKLDDDEREAMRKERRAESTAAALKKFDKNGDGKLDASERKAAKADRGKAAEDKKPADEKKDK